MKKSEIKIGKIYTNNGAGKTTRAVIEIYVNSVKYRQNGNEKWMNFESFARWAGREVGYEL